MGFYLDPHAPRPATSSFGTASKPVAPKYLEFNTTKNNLSKNKNDDITRVKKKVANVLGRSFQSTTSFEVTSGPTCYQVAVMDYFICITYVYYVSPFVIVFSLTMTGIFCAFFRIIRRVIIIIKCNKITRGSRRFFWT